MQRRALVVIDVQNDYFEGGKLPLWRAEETLAHIEGALRAAARLRMPVVLVQHVADAQAAPFFNEGSEGAALHPRVLALAPGAPVVVKRFADAFHETRLEQVLSDLGATALVVCGMMTQNCVAHTAVSKAAEKYQVAVLSDGCTTVSELVHNLALRAVGTRLSVLTAEEALGPA